MKVEGHRTDDNDNVETSLDIAYKFGVARFFLVFFDGSLSLLVSQWTPQHKTTIPWRQGHHPPDGNPAGASNTGLLVTLIAGKEGG